MQKENLILVVIGFADTVALNLYMSQDFSCLAVRENRTED